MFKKLMSQNTPVFEVITFRVQINITIEKKYIYAYKNNQTTKTLTNLVRVISEFKGSSFLD